MSPPALLGFLKRWWLLLLAGPLLAGLAGYAFVGRISPVYQATTTLLVNRGSVSTTGVDDPTGAEQLARTYAEALKTRPVLDAAAQRIDQPELARDLAQAVTVRTISGTQLLRVSVEDRSPGRAADLANAVVAVFTDQNLEMQASRYAASRQSLEQLVSSLRTELDTRSTELQQLRATLPAGDPQLARVESEFAQLQAAYGDSVRTFESLRVGEARGLNSVTVVEPAIAATDPIRPNRVQTTALAVLAGLVAVIVAARVIDVLDDGLGSRERLATLTGLRTLGTIPRWRKADSGLVATMAQGASADTETARAAEGYRLLFSRMMISQRDLAADDQPRMAIMVTSARVEEGKSLTAANLAAVFAEAGRRVILVDTDVYRPSQMKRFQLPSGGGWSTVLVGPATDVSPLLRDTSVPGLQILTSGSTPAAPSAVFGSRNLARTVAELRQHCDVVIFDCPAVLNQPDVALLGQHVDGVLLVVDARTSHAGEVHQTVELLKQAGIAVWGAALNRVSKRHLDYVAYHRTSDQSQSAPGEEAKATSNSVRAARGQAS
ncbi:MAG TPA: polysaccharide biosynthesis tyrosine autokinase [Chloroflexota bacterium]|nr:polysaccharide biosynthesis tyrosine autokinase [Chloroflexota bacterium]